MNMERYHMISSDSPRPHGSRPHEATFYTPHNVRNNNDWLELVRAQDHCRLVSMHGIYAHDTLFTLLAQTSIELRVKVSLLTGQNKPLC